MRGKGTISFPPWNSFLENWSKKNPHSSSEPRKFSSRLLLSRRWAVAGNNVFRAERGREGRGGERAAGLPPPPRPPARLSIRRTDVRQRVTLSAALALIHVGDAECYGNRRNKKRNGGEPPSPPPPPLAPRRSTMNLLHDRQSIRRGRRGAGVFRPPSRVVTSTRSDVPVRMDNRLRIFIPLLFSLLPWNFRIFFNFGGWNSSSPFSFFGRIGREREREMPEKYRSNLSFFSSLTEIKRKYKSFFPWSKDYSKDLIF